MPVAVQAFQRRTEERQQQQPEESAIDKLLKGLQIAGSAMGLYTNLQQAQAYKQQQESGAFELGEKQKASKIAEEVQARGERGEYTPREIVETTQKGGLLLGPPPTDEEKKSGSVLSAYVLKNGQREPIFLRQTKPVEMAWKSLENQLTREEKLEVEQKKMEFDRQQKQMDRDLKSELQRKEQNLKLRLDDSRKQTQQMMYDLKRDENPAAQKRLIQSEAMADVDANLVRHVEKVKPQDRENIAQLALPFGMKSTGWQDYETSALQFLDPLARVRTGAAMPKDEFQKYFQQYFPMPGDSNEMVEFKARFRQLAIQEVAANRAYSAPTPAGISVPKNVPQAMPGQPVQPKPSAVPGKQKTFKASDLQL